MPGKSNYPIWIAIILAPTEIDKLIAAARDILKCPHLDLKASGVIKNRLRISWSLRLEPIKDKISLQAH